MIVDHIEDIPEAIVDIIGLIALDYPNINTPDFAKACNNLNEVLKIVNKEGEQYDTED